jgi:hydrogenase maturation protein HypF
MGTTDRSILRKDDLAKGGYQVNTGAYSFRFFCDARDYPTVGTNTIARVRVTATRMDTMLNENGRLINTTHRELSERRDTLSSPIPTFAHQSRKLIRVHGVVQGVGFRPFVYNLARSLKLTGFVFNSTAGVTIEIEGDQNTIQQFLERLGCEAPPLAELTEVAVFDGEVRGDVEFLILHSQPLPGEFVLISPDVGTCDACWSDFGDQANRRHGYPFTNCTHCGPRYSIIQNVPYDRATTTMAAFAMCAACAAEYNDPTDRRFHAQPNACAECGPSLVIVPRGTSSEECVFQGADSIAAIHMARDLLRMGKILAVKGMGGFLLACDARNEAAVAELRRRKRRPDKPFAVMARDMEEARKMCEVSAAEEATLRHLRRSIVILPHRRESGLSPEVAPGNETLGVMLPYTPLHYLLFSDSPGAGPEFSALVMTSGNLSEEPIVVSNEEALRQLDGVADWFLLHNREIAIRVDDSVVRTFEGRERVMRRSRGYVPQAIDLGLDMEELVAFGGELKNTFCLTKGHYAILSQHIGDLENYETMQFFEETLDKMKRLFRVTPRAVAHDLHPNYRSTRMALGSGIERKIAVQHHHAHIASCMAENHLRCKVIGVAMDGTGYGMDGCIWGGEFLVADFAGFERRGHLRYVGLAGGDAAVRQPWRMALSYLRDTFGQQIPDGLGCFRGVGTKQLAIVDKMLAQRLQTVETSSCGRLFDAVAALLGLAQAVTFEGQAAMALETAADWGVETRYEFGLDDGQTQVDFRPVIAAIVKDLLAGRRVGEIAAKFHNALSAAILAVCRRIRTDGERGEVCLSGGCFQNMYLLRRTVEELRRAGFGVCLHTVVPANDGGLSLGQAAIANELLRRGD